MDDMASVPGVAAGRLSTADYETNFAPVQSPLSAAEAIAAAERCLFCEDAPCIAHCPTDIDVPGFLELIIAGDRHGAGMTILENNVLGGLCARVCPTEAVCEGACVYASRDMPPVEIARLQRFATDGVQERDGHPFAAAPDTGRKIAIVGSGPAGLACAHALAMDGHSVDMFEAKSKPGGLMEYGIPAYKLPAGVMRAEVDWLMQIGGITLHTNTHLGRDLTLDGLRANFDAVCLAMGKAGANALRIEGERLDNVMDAVDFITALLSAQDPALVPVGHDVVVLGGDLTALDAAMQAKLLGAAHVTMVTAVTAPEQLITEMEAVKAKTLGIRIIADALPTRLLGDQSVQAVDLAREADDPRGASLQLKADQVFKAIGQHLDEAPGGLRLKAGQIDVTATGQTSLPGVWAVGDCTASAGDLAVLAIKEGRNAAADMSRTLNRVSPG